MLEKINRLLELGLGFLDPCDIHKHRPDVGFNIDLGFAFSDGHETSTGPELARHPAHDNEPDSEKQKGWKNPRQECCEKSTFHVP